MHVIASSVALALAVAAPAAGQVTLSHYEVADLGTPAAHSSVCPCFFPQAMNDAGDVAGFFFGEDGTYNAFVTSGGSMLDISPPGDNRAFARGANDLGHVVGWTDHFAPQHGFLWNGTELIDLGTLGGTYSDAHDVNDAGQVVGSASTAPPDDDSHAAVWQDGAWTDLGTLGGVFSEAQAISETGTIVGWSWNAAWDAKPVYWNADGSGPLELPLLPGADPEWLGYANDVNDAGLVVGQVQVGTFEGFTQWRAVAWDGAVPTDLGLLDEAGEGSNEYFQTAHVSTAARGVNASGVIVGMSTPAASTPQLRPGPWVLRLGAMTNLNDLLVANDESWIIMEVAGIADDGTIAASARTPDDGHSRAVLLVPHEVLAGDVNHDERVDVLDLLALLAAWGPCAGCFADLDDDRVVAITDLLMLLSNWS